MKIGLHDLSELQEVLSGKIVPVKGDQGIGVSVQGHDDTQITRGHGCASAYAHDKIPKPVLISADAVFNMIMWQFLAHDMLLMNWWWNYIIPDKNEQYQRIFFPKTNIFNRKQLLN